MKKLSEHFKHNYNGKANEKAIIQGDKYRFTVLTSQLIRIEYNEEGIFEDRPTQSVVNREFELPKFRVNETEDKLEIVTDNLHLYYKKEKLTSNSLFADVKGNFNHHGSRWYYGQKSTNLGGTSRTLDNVDGSMDLEDGVLSKEGFSVMDDSKSHIITEEGWVEPRKKDVIDIYFWAYGREYLNCMKDFFKLTGPTPLLPRYSLGNWWSRYWAYSEDEYKDLMLQFKKEDIPFSVSVIDMDWHVTDVDSKYGTGWTGYTWNKDLFPNPPKFLEWLHEEGLKTTLNLHPASGVRAFEEMYEPMAKELGFDYENEEPIPFDITNKDFLEAYFKHLHNPLEKEGVDFWWIDWQQGETTGVEGLDPLWMLNHYHYFDINREDKNSIIFSRYAGVGSHRYPVGFSGDTITTWDSYKFQPYFTATASNIGYCWWSHDIGGHMLGSFDEELSARWLQYGVFSPIMRLHSSSSSFSCKEPWNYSMEIEKTMKEHLRLRHKLVPYIYTMNYRLHKDLEPFISPMYYYYPMKDNAYNFKNQYFFGSELLIIPVTEKIKSSVRMAPVKAWIPEGMWFNFFNGDLYEGERTTKLYRGIDEQVVLAKAGAIIPMAKLKLNDINNPKSLEILAFLGKSNKFTLVESSENSKEDMAFTDMELVWDKDKKFIIEPTRGNLNCIPNTREIKIMFRGVTEELLENIKIVNEHKKDFNKKEKTLTIYIKEWCVTEKIIIEINDKENQCIDKNYNYLEKVFVLLKKAQIPNVQKDIIYGILKGEQDKLKVLSSIRQLEIEEDLFDAILEILS